MEFDALLNFEDVLNTYKSKEAGVKALSKYSYWFPLRASPNLAGIVADLMGDGHLQDYPKLRLDYTSKSLNELDRFNFEMYKTFRIKGNSRKCFTNHYGTYNLGINCKPLVRTLKLIGVPTGSKVLIKFDIPKWILQDKSMFSRFANRLFSCEGSVDIKNRYLEIQMYKSESLANDGVKTIPIRMKIKNMGSLINFRNFVSIDDPAKIARLKLITENNINKSLILA